jgi:DNA polymerase-1
MARMTPAAVEEKYMLTPTQYPDFAALRGDPSDNLPSVPGVGERTAAKWIIEYGSLEELLNKADQVPGKAGESLRANLDSIAKNRELTQLIHDVPIELSLSDLAWSTSKFEECQESRRTVSALRDRRRSHTSCCD